MNPELGWSKDELIGLHELVGRMRDGKNGVSIKDRRWYLKNVSVWDGG